LQEKQSIVGGGEILHRPEEVPRGLIRAALLAQPLQTALSAEPSSCSQEMYVVSTLTITTATRLPFGRETATLR
jgi:hypothetical protein